MSDALNMLAHHQRILLTGPETEEVWAYCEKALSHFQKPFALFRNGEISGDPEAPIVFIFSPEPTHKMDPHIALIHHVEVAQMAAYEQLVRHLPKAGTLVYHEGNSDIQALANIEVADVQKEPFASQDAESAAKAILKRLGINEKRYAQVS